MKIGTKSILYGIHAFWLHPIFVAIAWRQIFGMPWNPRLWIAFFVHDLGYWGKPNMDGPEGETHIGFGARVMERFGLQWYRLCYYHSRFWAKKHCAQISSLCIADKWAMIITPVWLYLLMARATGEIREYRTVSKHREDSGLEPDGTSWASDRQWCDDIREHMINWIYEQVLHEDYDAFPHKFHMAILPCRRPQ